MTQLLFIDLHIMGLYSLQFVYYCFIIIITIIIISSSSCSSSVIIAVVVLFIYLFQIFIEGALSAKMQLVLQRALYT